MRTIRWSLDVGYPLVKIAGEIEVEDATTDAEIDEQVRDEIWNRISFSWQETDK